MCDQITFVYMLQSPSGVGTVVPTVSLALGNAMWLGFAHDEVITKSNHADVDQYVVYPVRGIAVPS